MNYAGVLAGQKNESLMTCQQREDNLVNTGQKQIHLMGLFGILACFLSYSLSQSSVRIPRGKSCKTQLYFTFALVL